MILARRLLPIMVATLLVASEPGRVEAGGWSAAFDVGTGFDLVDAVYPTTDGGYLFTSQDWQHLTKLSGSGEVIWSRTLQPYGGHFVPAGEGFLFVGYHSLIRLNGLGEALWSRSLTFNASLARPRELSDGSILIGADRNSDPDIGNRPFIAKLTGNGDILWKLSVNLPVLSASDVGWLQDLLPLTDSGFLALMTTFNYQSGENHRSADYVVRFSADGTLVWATTLVGMNANHPQATGVTTLGKTQSGGYFAYGDGTLIALDSAGNVKGFRGGLPSSPYGIQPTLDGGYIAVGQDYSFRTPRPNGPLVQKLDGQLNSEWVRKFPFSADLILRSIASTPAGGWILGGQTIPPGQSDYHGWIFRLSSGGQPFGSCPVAVDIESDLGNGNRQCEVQVTYPSPPPALPIATVIRCDPPAVPPGFSPVRQDFDFTCGPGTQPYAIQCTVTTRNNYSGYFNLYTYVGPNSSATFDVNYGNDTPPGTNFVGVSTPGVVNITSAPALVSTEPGPALATEPTSISWLPYNVSRSLLCSGEPEPPTWVALGDSYSSGEGAGASHYLAETKIPGQNICHRSDTTYPRVTRELDKIANSFFACSGATTPNVLGAAQLGKAKCFQQKTPPFLCSPTYSSPDDIPQLDHPEVAEADLITITIGGNDVAFSSVLKWCFQEEDCRTYKPQGMDTSLSELLQKLIDGVKLRLEMTLAAIRAKAPSADLRVLGYPALFPTDPVLQRCATLADPLDMDWLPGVEGSFSPYEQNWLNGLVPLLNDAIQQAATSVNARFISVTEVFSGHEICGSWGSWFRELNWGALRDLAETFHPTATGHFRGYRQALEDDLLSMPIGSGEATLAPSPEQVRALARRVKAAEESLPTLDELSMSIVSPACGYLAVPGHTLAISGEGFAAGATVSIALHAPTRQVLTSVSADGTGSFGTTVVLPTELVPRVLARLEAAGRGANLQPRVLVAHFTIGPPLQVDQDGDSVPDACDNCPVLTNATQSDADADGLGDACDPCPTDDRNECRLDFYTVTPCRIVDTRTADFPALSSFVRRVFQAAGRCGIPATAKVISANVTVVGATAGGHLALWPSNQALPPTSVINFRPGQMRANNAFLSLATDGSGELAAEAFQSSGSTVHLVVDVSGYFQ